METHVTNYQCPCCTAPLQYKPHSGKLGCDFCRRQYTIREIKAYYPEQNRIDAASENLWGEGAEKMRAYSCPSCGAELICEETTGATGCPYCGNYGIIPAQFAGTKRPEYIIPFALTKEDAVAALRKSCKHRFLLPKEFARKQCLKKIRGVYVPFWLFDARASADITFDASREDETISADEEETIIEHYSVRRAGNVAFERVPADGSQSMPDDYMDGLEPFDYEGLQPFSMGYLPGFMADRYDIGRELVYSRVEQRMKQSVRNVLMDTVDGYDKVRIEHEDISVMRKRSHYALLPVWMLHASYENEEYLFAVNGQTGKTVGRFPISQKKLRAALWGIGAAVAAGAAAVLTALWAYIM